MISLTVIQACYPPFFPTVPVLPWRSKPRHESHLPTCLSRCQLQKPCSSPAQRPSGSRATVYRKPAPRMACSAGTHRCYAQPCQSGNLHDEWEAILCYTTLLHGLRGRNMACLEAGGFQLVGDTPDCAHQLGLTTQHRRLCHENSRQNRLHGTRQLPDLLMIVEFVALQE